MGLALSLHNRFIFEEIEDGLEIVTKGAGLGLLPADESNLIYRSAAHLFNAVGRHPSGLRIVAENHVPVASGMGSSSTAVVGGLVGANCVLGAPLTDDELVAMAVAVEGHPDNVVPALVGGVTLTVMAGEDEARPIIHRIEVNEAKMNVTIILPEYELKTADARDAMPETVPLADAIFNVGRTALVMKAIETADYDLLGIAMQDRLHQPYRYPLVPGLEAAVQAALDAGAAGAAISGSGPGFIVFAESEDGMKSACTAGLHTFTAHGLNAQAWPLTIDNHGTIVSSM